MSSNWLPGAPHFYNGLMISGKYDSTKDDTEYFQVYTYPELVNLGKFSASRFSEKQVISQYYPELCDKDGPIFDGVKIKDTHLNCFRVWRDLYPHISNNFQWLQVVSYGLFDVLRDTMQFEYSVVYFEPLPFEEIVETCKQKYNSSNI